MHKEIADKWTTALYSGDYQQTTGALELTPESAKRDDVKAGFCCLGVLCDLAVKEGIIIREVDEFGDVLYGTPGDMCGGELPEAVVHWSGMNSTDGRRDNSAYNAGETDELSPNLVTLNDGQYLPFATIAGVIEAEFETL